MFDFPLCYPQGNKIRSCCSLQGTPRSSKEHGKDLKLEPRMRVSQAHSLTLPSPRPVVLQMAAIARLFLYFLEAQNWWVRVHLWGFCALVGHTNQDNTTCSFLFWASSRVILNYILKKSVNDNPSHSVPNDQPAFASLKPGHTRAEGHFCVTTC